MAAIARHKVASTAEREGLVPEHTVAKEGRELRRKAGGQAQAKPFKLLRRSVERQRTTLGSLLRHVRLRRNRILRRNSSGLAPRGAR